MVRIWELRRTRWVPVSDWLDVDVARSQLSALLVDRHLFRSYELRAA